MTNPRVLTTKRQLRNYLGEQAEPLAVVMTMGALHEGHLSLVRQALSISSNVLVTIFVNPQQFGPDEDLDRYPRTLDADLAHLRELGVPAVFAPQTSEIYPQTPRVHIDAGDITRVWEGAARAGHFDGVGLVVTKLLNMTGADVAIFGEKDYQQLAVIRRIVSELDMAVEILGGPIVRDPDGLAMSSRNVYLSPQQREQALALHRSLQTAQNLAAAATMTGSQIAAQVSKKLREGGLDLDYFAIVDQNLHEVTADHIGPARAIVAARVGTTRLIDNAEVVLPGEIALSATGR